MTRYQLLRLQDLGISGRGYAHQFARVVEGPLKIRGWWFGLYTTDQGYRFVFECPDDLARGTVFAHWSVCKNKNWSNDGLSQKNFFYFFFITIDRRCLYTRIVFYVRVEEKRTEREEKITGTFCSSCN